MKKIFVTIILCLLLVSVISAQQSTSFSYQGKLNSSSAPANGTYDFKFELFSVLNNGTAIGTVNSNAVQVISGNFTVQLDFGANAFDGTERYLEISVKLPSESNFTTLTPRQKISSVPYAIKAINADTATVAQTANNATNLGGISANNYLLNNGDGSQLVNVNGSIKWNIITTDQQAQSNNSYFANSPNLLAITLPPNPQLGDSIRIFGAGTGGWRLVTSFGQSTPLDAWSAKESNRNWFSVASSADGTKLVAGVDNGQIYTSADAGITWAPRATVRSWQSIASSADGTKLVAASFGQLYTSSDSGVNWTPRGVANLSWISVASSADGTKLVGAVINGQIYTSTDSGVTWIPRETNRQWVSVTSSADGTKLVAVVFGGQIYTSTDSGVTWTPRESNRTWWAVASSADGTKLAVAVNNGQIYTSTDSGVTWTPRENNRNWRAIASSADGKTLIASVLNDQLFVSKDFGVTWTPQENIRNWRGVALSADGIRMTAVALGGQVYTFQPPTGIQNSYLELIYTGNGQFYVFNQR